MRYRRSPGVGSEADVCQRCRSTAQACAGPQPSHRHRRLSGTTPCTPSATLRSRCVSCGRTVLAPARREDQSLCRWLCRRNLNCCPDSLQTKSDARFCSRQSQINWLQNLLQNIHMGRKTIGQILQKPTVKIGSSRRGERLKPVLQRAAPVNVGWGGGSIPYRERHKCGRIGYNLLSF